MRNATRERGQVPPVVALALPGIAAFSIGVGCAFHAWRQLVDDGC